MAYVNGNDVLSDRFAWMIEHSRAGDPDPTVLVLAQAVSEVDSYRSDLIQQSTATATDTDTDPGGEMQRLKVSLRPGPEQ